MQIRFELIISSRWRRASQPLPTLYFSCTPSGFIALIDSTVQPHDSWLAALYHSYLHQSGISWIFALPVMIKQQRNSGVEGRRTAPRNQSDKLRLLAPDWKICDKREADRRGGWGDAADDKSSFSSRSAPMWSESETSAPLLATREFNQARNTTRVTHRVCCPSRSMGRKRVHIRGLMDYVAVYV